MVEILGCEIELVTRTEVKSWAVVKECNGETRREIRP